MKILHVVPSYFPAVRYGGPIWSVHGLARAQAALGHEVSVYTTNADGPGVSDVPVGRPVDMESVAITYFAVGQPRRLFRAPAMAVALEQAVADFDVVHLHSVFLWPTLVAARAAKRAGTPYVLSPRGMLVKELIEAKSAFVKRAWLTLFERRTIRDAAFLHVTAAREADDLAALGLTARRIVTLPNGVEPPPPQDDLPLSADIEAATAQSGYALYLGRLNWKKNLVVLVEAMTAAPALRLVIAGNDEEGHARDIDAAIAAHGLAGRVTVIARSVDGADKEALFARAGLFVLPSLNENFGNSALEAMARGLPCIISNGAGIAEIVTEAGAGLVVPPDVPSLGAALADLSSRPDEARAMGDRGARAATGRYGWETVATDMLAAYASVRGA